MQASAGPSAADLCEKQLAGGGPGVESAKDGVERSLAVDELGAWPELAETARRQGVTAVIAHPIRLDANVVGTFNLFVKGPVEDSARVAKLLAENAAASISNARVYAGARALASQLGDALESRGVIEQAKGILMAVQGCGPDDAFDILRRASQRQNRKLRVVAEEMVTKAARRNVPRAPE